MTDVRLQHDEMHRLIFIVRGSGIVYIGELVEGQLAIERQSGPSSAEYSASCAFARGRGHCE